MSERFIAFEGVRKSYDGVSYVVRGLDLDVAKGEFLTLLGPSGSVKSFGRRQAYESPRGRNPRATVGGYGDFDLGLISAMARPRPGSGVLDADRPLRCASARFSRPGSRLDATLLAAIITMNARGSVAGGGAPAAEVWIMPCRVMKQSPGSSPSH
ncbi:hypothetical protein ACC687_25930, partial [Rhizobium ruizarguesonis]